MTMDDQAVGDLSMEEVRVLGALMEKARTTPDVYPLTLNSLVTACNQKSSRDPVTDYDEDEVIRALDSLRDKGLAMRVDMAGSRTAKFRESATTKWELSGQEYALLTLLFLRGPQTPGQLRGRSERLFEFAEIPQVLDWLDRMQDREEEPLCMIRTLPRTPGTKEVRYTHTFLPPSDDEGTIETMPQEVIVAAPKVSEPPLENRLSELEERVEALEKLIDDLTS